TPSPGQILQKGDNSPGGFASNCERILNRTIMKRTLPIVTSTFRSRARSPLRAGMRGATKCTPYLLAICLLVTAVSLMTAPARAATNDLTTAIQRGLFEEEANQNLGAAIQAYQSVANQFDKDRK